MINNMEIWFLINNELGTDCQYNYNNNLNIFIYLRNELMKLYT